MTEADMTDAESTSSIPLLRSVTKILLSRRNAVV
jgi:hypothetical protein